MNKTFFDVHCHLFNLIDVPLWETVRGVMRMHTLLGLAACLEGDDIVERQRYFIRFFERSSETNLKWFAQQLRHAIKEDDELSKYLGFPSSIIITPLVMDFDTNIKVLPDMVGDESVESQYDRLHQAICQCSAELSAAPIPIRVFPFMGFALDKLNGNDPQQVLAGFKRWWQRNGLSADERKQPWQQIPQKAIGIKLYPALGFKPNPALPQRSIYLEFYHWCVENDIPLTVHCQAGSFKPNDPLGTDGNGSPEYWVEVLKTEGLQNLRLNFAHFGGGGSLPELIDTNNVMNTGNKTYLIIRMLLDYPNTFADLSAIDFSNPTIGEAFARLLTKDLNGELNSSHSLCDKLLWGSDVPMIIESPQYHRSRNEDGPEMGYIHCLRYFKHALSDVRSIDGGVPNQPSQTKQMEVMQKIISVNPERFLHH